MRSSFCRYSPKAIFKRLALLTAIFLVFAITQGAAADTWYVDDDKEQCPSAQYTDIQ